MFGLLGSLPLFNSERKIVESCKNKKIKNKKLFTTTLRKELKAKGMGNKMVLCLDHGGGNMTVNICKNS